MIRGPHPTTNGRFIAIPSPKSSYYDYSTMTYLYRSNTVARLQESQSRKGGLLGMIASRRTLVGFATLSISVLPFTANAADMYRAPPPVSYKDAPVYVPPNTWAGFYVGINGGYGWGDGGNSIGYNGAGSFVDGDGSRRAQPEGAFGGGQIGYNFQSGSFVYGVETDFQGGDLNDSAAGITANGNSYSTKERVDWFGTARGRLGYAFNRTLLYGTGGFAYGNVHQSAFATDGVNSVSLRSSDVQTGFAVGGGVEYKVSPAWSLKAEYQYIDLGNEKLTGMDSSGAAASTNNLDTNFHTARIGLNYRFGGGAEPLK
jgi:outer membrane immunogenic protein